MKDELDGKITTKFAELRPKMYSYLIDEGSSDKTVKGTSKCVTKRRLKFEDYKKYLQQLVTLRYNKSYIKVATKV